MRDLKVTDVRVQAGDSAFLIDDGETSILYDTGFGFTGFAVADKIKECLGTRELDYIFLTHSHYDHALGSAYIIQRYPEAKVVAGEYAAGIFKRDGAKAVMRDMDRKFADRCGVGEYPFLGDKLRVDIPASDGDVIKAGDMRFEVLALPGHTKCSVGFYCEERELLLSSETLGVYDGGELIVPSYLVGYEMSLRAIERVGKLKIKKLISPHLGLLDEEHTKYFLENAKSASIEAAELLAQSVRDDLSDEEIIEKYKRRYWKGYIRDIYPEDAVDLNTSIMLKLIRREILEIVE
ncbi:MAG: MBL fold metallo-hydrolase [Ruminococcaceae bacterium]|nr:MBL fold metallo-hydrolase [Oscillospiraceae bacterium]